MESALAPVLNHLLAQHTWAAARLRVHAGKQARLVLGGQSLCFTITDDGFLGAGAASESNAVEIEVPASALKSIGDGMDGIMAHVRITGNAELADTLSFVARHLRWDREADLARVFGPILGRRMHLTARGLERGLPDAAKRLASNATEYLVHEGGVLVAHDEMERRLGELRRFRDDLARLGQRIDRLDR